MQRALRSVVIASLCSVVLAGSTNAQDARKPLERRASVVQAGRGPIRVWMRDIVFYPYDDAPSRVAELSGSVAPTHQGGTVTFDDVGSFGIRVEHAQVHISAASMSVLMNRYVLPAANGPIRHVDVSFGAGVIQMKGTMVKAGVPVPFTATAVAEPTPDGDMQLRIVKMTAAGVVPKGLMDALGLQISKVAQPDNREIFHVVGDTMVLPVVSMFPPPKFSGRLRSVVVSPTEMIGVIGSAHQPRSPGPASGSYMYFRGGALSFAKLTMQDADMTIVPKDRSGPFGFSPAHYYRQMQAGYTVPQADRGLVAHVPDYGRMLTRR